MKAAIVAIGRNEGERLQRSLSSALRQGVHVVYVDSGSTDGSPALARSMDVDVVELSATSPYTAARARNQGFEFLLRQDPAIEVVQFLDGDCELANGWIDRARSELEKGPDVAVVCGRRRERHANRSVFNRLLDLEADTPAGETAAFGGDALVRVLAFRQAAGFNPTLIAGEEPELSLRMRQRGWKILRIEDEMTLHDAEMTRFGQWWRRTLRSGYAYAEGAWMHGLEAEHHWLRESLSIWFWGAFLPLSAAGLAWGTSGGALLLVALYPVLALRVYLHMRRRHFTRHDAFLYAAFCVLAKFPQALGQIRFHAGRWTGRRSRLIEYRLT